MKSWIKKGISALVFAILLVACLIVCYSIMIPKYIVESTNWPSTSTFRQFYTLEKDSVDVIFLGSSSMASAAIPQTLYDDYGYTSYNMSTVEQTLPTSFYWLQEILRFQNPKVVFLDNQMLFTYYEDEELNYKEPGFRKDFDYMKWSPVKVKAVHEICSFDDRQSELSYYFPNIRYHDRWKELKSYDFHYETTTYYGYAPLATNIELEGDAENLGEKADEVVPLMKDYMDRIVSLCKEKGITLVLVSTLTPAESELRFEKTNQYAMENGLDFIDFNQHDLYEAAGLDADKDCSDKRHMNLSGARKLTRYFGNYLLDKNLVSTKTSDQYEKTKNSFIESMKEYEGN